MATGRASRSVVNKIFDWVAISNKVPAYTTTRGDLQALRARHEQFRAQMLQYPEEPQAIDWKYYRNRITAPGFVDQMEKTYKTLLSQVPYPPDQYTAEIDAWEKKEDIRFEQIIKDCEVFLDELNISSEFVKNMPAFEDLSETEIDSYFPTKKLRVDRLIEASNEMVDYLAEHEKIFELSYEESSVTGEEKKEKK